MSSFIDELVKISQAELAGKALGAVAKHWKPLGLVGAGAAGMHLGSKEVDKYLLGRRLYEQMQARG